MSEEKSQYEWTPEQSRNGAFENAKRKIAKYVKGQLPYGWSYKVIAPYRPNGTLWEIKMDYGVHPFITLRWRPCIPFKEMQNPNYYRVEIHASSDGIKGYDCVEHLSKPMSDIPKILELVKDIFDGLNPDPIMQLHARAKRDIKATLSPKKEFCNMTELEIITELNEGRVRHRI